MEKKVFSFGLYRVEVLSQDPEQTPTDGTILFVRSETPAETSSMKATLSAALQKLRDAIQSLVQKIPGSSVVFRPQKDPRPVCGDMVFISDYPRLTWRTLLSYALHEAQDKGYETVSIILRRPTDVLPREMPHDRAHVLARDICEAVQSFFSRNPLCKVTVVKLLTSESPVFVKELRVVWTEALDAKRSPKRSMAN